MRGGPARCTLGAKAVDNGGLRYGAMESALRPPLPTATQTLAELQIQPWLDQRLRAKHHRRDPRKQTPSGRHQIGIPAGFKSESVAGFLLECVAGFVGIRTSWQVRWLVIDCGTWLTGRKVLMHPSAISRQDLEQQEFVVALTKAQVEGSPELVEDQPVSQQMETQLYTYYGWDPLWGGPNLAAVPGAMASPLMAPPYLGLSSADEVAAHGDGVTLRGADPHLRSIVEVTGYRVHALDGEIGHIENFMIDDADWSVHYLIVDTRNWWFGKHALISPIAVKSVDWFDRHVELDVPGEQVRASPPWDPLDTFSQVYAKQLHRHYGWPGPAA